MKKKVLSDSDEVSGCALDISIDRLEKRDHCLCPPTGCQSTVFVTIREWGVLFCQLNVSFCQPLNWVKIHPPPLVQRALTVYWRI